MESNNFIGQNALIIAASKGIGFAIAKSLYLSGCNVFLNSSDLNNLKLAESELLKLNTNINQEVHLLPFDINKGNTLNKGIDEFLKLCDYKIDVLVTNTVSVGYNKFPNQGKNDWEKAVEIKFNVVSSLVQKIIPYMIKSKQGNIVNIGSIDTKEIPFAANPSTIVRQMVSSYLKSIADNVADNGVRVNQVLCGYTLTDTLNEYFEKKSKEKNNSKEDIEMEIKSKIPMKRFAKPDEIGNVVKFLCSDEASYITGQSIIVDGGLIRAL